MNEEKLFNKKLALAETFVQSLLSTQHQFKPSPPYQHRDDIEEEFARNVSTCYLGFQTKSVDKTAYPIFVVHGLPGMGKTRFGEEALNILRSQTKTYPRLSQVLRKTRHITREFQGAGDAICDFDESLNPEQSMAARVFCRLSLDTRLDRVVDNPQATAVLQHLVKSGSFLRVASLLPICCVVSWARLIG